MKCTVCGVTNAVNSDEATKALKTGVTICSECSNQPMNKLQERTYEKCPTCLLMHFWDGQCYDVNCYASTPIKKLNQRLIYSAKEENKTHANKCQAPATPWSKTTSK